MARSSDIEKVILEVVKRESAGKESSAALRREGFIPAVVYGEGKAALAVQVPARSLSHALRTKAGENVLITLRLTDDGKELPEKTVLIEELQRHPVSHQIIHVDFHHVSLTKQIKVTVPLAFHGEAIGVKQEGGVLEHLRWDLEVECLPTQIPAQVAVDVSSLAVGKALHVKEIVLPEGVRLITDPELSVVSCIIPKVEEAAPAPTETAEAVEPEVIKQKKPEEEAASQEPAAGKEKEQKQAPEGKKG